MKRYIIVPLLLGTSFAVNATTVTVEGRGSDREAAKRDAFRTAIENVCGTMVLSDREHFNNSTVNNQIVTHSSCNVEKYTVLEESPGRIKITVEVTPNQIAQRLQPKAENKHFVNVPNLEAQVETFKTEKLTGDQLISEIFRDYPNRAFTLKSKTQIIANSYQKYSLRLDYELAWNDNFTNALKDIVKGFAKPMPWYQTYSNLSGRVSIGSSHYYTDDLHRIDTMKRYFQDGLYVKVQAKDFDNKNLLDICLINSGADKGHGYMYNAEMRYYHDHDGTDDQLTIRNVKNSRWALIELKFPPTKIYEIVLSVVTSKDCTNFW